MREQYSMRLAITTGALILLVAAGFALFQSPELLDFPETAAVKSAGMILHPIEKRRDCTGCHGRNGVKPYPVKHAGWSIGSCTRCHTPAPGAAPDSGATEVRIDEITGTARPTPHPVQGMEECGACHGLDADHPYPEDHAGRPNDSCTVCHTL